MMGAARGRDDGAAGRGPGIALLLINYKHNTNI
jgi:hypothetical protein